MKASVIQSLLSRNRNEISRREGWATFFKECSERKYNFGLIEEGHLQVKLFRQQRKEIAKLVTLQKELKKALREEYEFERITEVF
jgi:hypothetical protein